MCRAAGIGAHRSGCGAAGTLARFMPVRSLLSCLACALLLALPAAALAQGAGDEQYNDPFGDEQEQPEPTPTPTPVPAAPPPPPPAAPAQVTPAPAAPGPAAPQLPRTGVDAGLVALAGALLLGGGLALRVRLREPIGGGPTTAKPPSG
jgi:LPXTG-motif cell wall-anchored protein